MTSFCCIGCICNVYGFRAVCSSKRAKSTCDLLHSRAVLRESAIDKHRIISEVGTHTWWGSFEENYSYLSVEMGVALFVISRPLSFLLQAFGILQFGLSFLVSACQLEL